MADADVGEFEVLVVWATPAAQTVRRVPFAAPMTIGDAIARSGILEAHPEIDLAANRVGVFGKLAALDRPACDGDRIEIYRPLDADPKESRRRRAAHRRNKG